MDVLICERDLFLFCIIDKVVLTTFRLLFLLSCIVIIIFWFELLHVLDSSKESIFSFELLWKYSFVEKVFKHNMFLVLFLSEKTRIRAPFLSYLLVQVLYQISKFPNNITIFPFFVFNVNWWNIIKTTSTHQIYHLYCISLC